MTARDPTRSLHHQTRNSLVSFTNNQRFTPLQMAEWAAAVSGETFYVWWEEERQCVATEAAFSSLGLKQPKSFKVFKS